MTFDSVAVGEAWGAVPGRQGRPATGNPLYLYAGAASDNNAFLFFEGAWNKLQPKIADGTFVIKNSSEAVALQDKATLTRDEMAKIIGQVTTNWNFDVAKNLAEANLTAATAADKGNVFILAPNDGTARSIADAFAADKDVTKYFDHRPGRREGLRPVHHRRQAVDDRPEGRPHAGRRCHHRGRRLPRGRDPDEDHHLQQRQDRCPGQAVRHRHRRPRTTSRQPLIDSGY